MGVPFNKIMVDSRRASSGYSTKSEVSLPETLTLPPRAVCPCADVVMAHAMPALGTHAHGSVKNKCYWLERTGPVGIPVTYLRVAMLDTVQAYTAPTLAGELATADERVQHPGQRVHRDL